MVAVLQSMAYILGVVVPPPLPSHLSNHKVVYRWFLPLQSVYLLSGLTHPLDDPTSHSQPTHPPPPPPVISTFHTCPRGGKNLPYQNQVDLRMRLSSYYQ